jgi:hypothetical protein
MESIRMYDSQRRVFTNEFDEICVVISLAMDDTSARMQVTILEPNRVWDELVPIPLDNADRAESR